MKKLTEYKDTDVFYRGTIIVIKDGFITPKGVFDKKYCMISPYGGIGNMMMLDLYKSIGGVIIHDIKPNVPGHYGVDKYAIKEWVDKYFKVFYTGEGYLKWSARIDEIVYIDELDNYFAQACRDIFV